MAEFGFFSAVLVAAVLHGAHAVRSHDAISMNAASLEGTASEFCDVDAENQKKFKDFFKLQLCPKTGCTWWDACPPQEDGKCPANCKSFKTVVRHGLVRAGQWLSDKIHGRCTRRCRYSDEEMLNQRHQGGFMITSAAWLAMQTPKFMKFCGHRLKDSDLTPYCYTKLSKIAAVLGFTAKAQDKADRLAKMGQVNECKKVMPPSIAPQLREALAPMIDFMVLSSKGSDDQKRVLKQKMMAARDRLAPEGYCDFARKAEPDISKMDDEQLKAMVVAASNNTLTDAQAMQKAKQIYAVGLEALANEIVDREEQEVLNHAESLEEDEDEENDAAGGSLLELGGRQLSHGIFAGIFTLLGSVIMRILWTATVGVFHTLTCLVTLGGETNLHDVTDIEGVQRAFWFVSCPGNVLRYGWGVGQTPYDDMDNIGLDWGSVAYAFQSL